MNYKIESVIKPISVGEYITHYRDQSRFIEYCKICHQYNNCWACPPYEYNTTDILRQYRKAYIIGTKIIIPEEIALPDPDIIPDISRKMLAEVREVLDEKLLELEKEYPGTRAFFAGTCFSCPNGKCTRLQNKPCIQPDKIRPSLEAFGFDIGKTTSEVLGIELKWSEKGELPDYYTLVSALFMNDEKELYFDFNFK